MREFRSSRDIAMVIDPPLQSSGPESKIRASSKKMQAGFPFLTSRESCANTFSKREDRSMNPTEIVLDIDGKRVPMNMFVRKIFIETIGGMLRPLRGVPDDPQEIRITIKRGGKE